jgi:hypothetical protein
METLVQRLGDLYINGKAAEPTKLELATFRRWVNRSYYKLPVDVDVVATDCTLADTVQRYRKNRILTVSAANIAHPYFSSWQNIQFRAVHDWHHIQSGADDSMLGECITYTLARNSSPAPIHWILRSEIVLQAAAAILTGQFQPQKLVYVN